MCWLVIVVSGLGLIVQAGTIAALLVGEVPETVPMARGLDIWLSGQRQNVGCRLGTWHQPTSRLMRVRCRMSTSASCWS
jgi:hypothetical protein